MHPHCFADDDEEAENDEDIDVKKLDDPSENVGDESGKKAGGKGGQPGKGGQKNRKRTKKDKQDGGDDGNGEDAGGSSRSTRGSKK